MPVVVVTGAAGFIGGHLVHALAARGDDVVAVDRRPTPRPAAGNRWRPVVLDLADPSALPTLARVAADADAVVHLAARTSVRASTPDIDRLRHRDIVRATRQVLAAVPAPTPLVVASSSSVYGGARLADGQLRPSAEDDPLDPRGGYARAKVAMEADVAAATAGRAAAGGPTVVVRPFTVVGEGQRADMALAIWLQRACSGLPLEVIGGLDRSRDLTDVHGVVAALLALVDRPRTGILNIGTGRPRTLREMVGAVEGVVGTRCRVVVRPAAAAEVPATFADTTRLRALLGAPLVTDLDDVVERQYSRLRTSPSVA